MTTFNGSDCYYKYHLPISNNQKYHDNPHDKIIMIIISITNIIVMVDNNVIINHF